LEIALHIPIFINHILKLSLMFTSPNQNPFPGIRSFEANEDYLFFGRERQVSDVASVLLETHFLSIIGSSGCGKSSLVKAGLIPALFKHKFRKLDKEWSLALFRPGDDPIGNLSKVLFDFYGEHVIQSDGKLQLADIETILRSRHDGLEKVVKEQARVADKCRLIIVDQFEEVFRFKRSETIDYSHKDALQFVQLFLNVLNNLTSDVYIIFTMRSDFLSECTEYEGLPEAINDGHYLVPRMSTKDKIDAIRKPVETFEGSISDRLVEKLLQDVGDDPDQLPVMQHALMRTWEYWYLNDNKTQVIDIDHYEAVGSMSGALSMHAEEVYNELDGARNQIITEKLFKSLTELGRDSRGIRRPTSLLELCTLTEAAEEEVIDVINSYRAPGRAFLMPPAEETLTSDTVIDISHESIMRIWIRLKDWVDEETKSAQLYLRLSKAAELYHEGNTGLWIDPELQLALQWKRQNKPNATWAMRYDPAFDRAMNFLDYSNKETKLEIAKKEEKQKRDLKRAKRFALILGTASVISLLFLLGSLKLMMEAEASEKQAVKKEKIAIVQKKEANKQRKEAIIQKKISEQQQLIAEQQKIITEEQKQIAIEQQEIAEYQRQEAVKQKNQADGAKKLAIVARDEAEQQKQVAVEQKQIADENRKKAETAQEKAERLRMLALAKSLAIKASELSKTGENDLSALLALQAFNFHTENEGRANEPDIFTALLDVTNEAQVFRNHKDAVRALAFSKSGTIVSCSDDGTIKVARQDKNSKPGIFNTGSKENGFRCLDIDANEEFVVAGNKVGEIVVCKILNPGDEPLWFKGHSSIVNDICIHPDGNRFFSAGNDGKLILWTINKSQNNNKLIYENIDDISGVAASPNGNIVVCGNNKGSIVIIDLNDPEKKPSEISTGMSPVKSLEFSKDGEVLAVGKENGFIKLYKADSFEEPSIDLIGHTSGITSICFNADGKTMASSSYDKSIRIWNYAEPETQPVIIERNDSWVYDISYSVDGNRIASCGADRSIQIFTVNSVLLADKICDPARKQMTLEEWNKYVGNDIFYRSICQ
jgi:WD40 repeat protein